MARVASPSPPSRSRSSRRWTMCSTITSAPSTTIPKSIAPSESRLAGIPARYIQMKAKSSESGMVSAVSSAARALPRKSNSTPITITNPSTSVRETVLSVLLTRSARSYKGMIFTPAGRRLLFKSSNAALTFARLVVDAEDAGLRRGAEGHPPDVAHEDRHAVRRLEHDVFHVADGLDQADAANHQALLSVVELRAAGVLIVGADGFGDPFDREAVFFQLERIDLDLELFDESAERRDVRDAGDLQQARDHDPVLNLAQLHRVFSAFVVCAFETVAVHLADARSERAERRRHPGRQHGVAQFFHDELPREIVVGRVGEGHFDYREAEDRARAARDHSRHVFERAFNRHGHLLLDLFGRMSGVERNHHGLSVGDVGVGLDPEVHEDVRPDPDKREAERDNEQPLSQREQQQIPDHDR